jgi:peptidase E
MLYLLLRFLAYEKKVQVPFKEIGYTIHSIHHEKNPADAVSNAEAIFIGK